MTAPFPGTITQTVTREEPLTCSFTLALAPGTHLPVDGLIRFMEAIRHTLAAQGTLNPAWDVRWGMGPATSLADGVLTIEVTALGPAERDADE